MTAGFPTLYSGVNFRSRLEARWAIMFDLLGITWEYEPAFPLAGYIPDFLIHAELERAPFARAPHTGLVLCEAKPVLSHADYEDPVRKIALSGWEHAAVVLAPVPWQVGENWAFGLGTERVERRDALAGGHNSWFPVGITDGNKLALGGGRDARKLWRTAGNKSQWAPPVPK